MPGLVPEGARCGTNMVNSYISFVCNCVQCCVRLSCVEIVNVYHDKSQPVQVLILRNALAMGYEIFQPMTD